MIFLAVLLEKTFMEMKKPPGKLPGGFLFMSEFRSDSDLKQRTRALVNLHYPLTLGRTVLGLNSHPKML